MARSVLFLFILVFFPFGAMSSPKDHCVSCLNEDILLVTPVDGCPNLLVLEDNVAVKNFTKKFEKSLYKGRTKIDFEKLSLLGKTDVFNSAFVESISSFRSGFAAGTDSAGASVVQRLLNRAGSAVPLGSDAAVIAVMPFMDSMTVSESLESESLPTIQVRSRLYLVLAKKYDLPVEFVVGFEDGPNLCDGTNANEAQVFGFVSDSESSGLFKIGKVPEDWVLQKTDTPPQAGQVLQISGKPVRLVQSSIYGRTPAAESKSVTFCALTERDFKNVLCKSLAGAAPK